MMNPLQSDKSSVMSPLPASSSLRSDLISLFSTELEQINQVIQHNLKSDIPLIEQVASHLIFAGGKRIRPCLVLASAALFGPLPPRINALATAVEFIHTATLLHDDVIDESDTRRSLPTAHTIWGNTASILVGDFLFAKSFELMVETNHIDVLKILSRTAGIIAEGEVHQLTELHNMDITEKTILKILGSKTAQLFGVACQTGALLAGASSQTAKLLFDYGFHLGLVFQITDDVLDYTAQNKRRGKNLGDDFREGKITLPIVYSYQKANHEEKEFLKDCFLTPTPSTDQLTKTIQLIQKYDGFNLCLNTAGTFCQKALLSLESLESENLPFSPRASLILDTLKETAHRCITREV